MTTIELAPVEEQVSVTPIAAGRRSLWLVPALLAWGVVYFSLPAFAAWVTYGLLHLPQGVPTAGTPHCATCGLDTMPGSALSALVEFFTYETPRVLLLLALVVFVMGIVRSFFAPGRTRRLLAGRREFTGNMLAALLGTVTPFCSCSAVPLFIGFVTAGVPLGITLTFLIAAPMINEVALALLFGLFGWQLAALYLGTGLCIAILAGWIIGRLRMEQAVEAWVYETPVAGELAAETLDWPARLHAGLDALREILGKVWPYIIAGIAVGAWIHAYMPPDALAALLGRTHWWSVPLAVLIGIPIYANAAAMIPVVQALLEKGAALGTVLAFMMATIGLSLPETIILRRVLKPRLIAVFIGIVAVGILIVGYLFNALLGARSTFP